MTADFNFYINRQGARGKQGEKGEQGFSPVVTVASNTPTEYILNVVTEDSSFTTPNLKANAINIISGAGKYVLFDESTNTMYNAAKPSELVDTTMLATTSNAGIIMIADAEDMEESSTDVAVTPKQLNDAIDKVESEIPADTVSHTELTTAINGVVTQIPGIADLSTAGIIKPDGVTTTVAADGTLTAIQSAPANMVTLDTEQTISANKRTTANMSFAPTIIGAGDKTVDIGQFGIILSSGLASTSWNVTTDSGDLKFAVSGYGSQSNGFTFTNNFTTIRLANTITIGNNTVLTNASVDGTTITYDNVTGKISATAGGDVTKAGNNNFTGYNSFTRLITTSGISNVGRIDLKSNSSYGNMAAVNLYNDGVLQGGGSSTNIDVTFYDYSGSYYSRVARITGNFDHNTNTETTTLDINADSFTRNSNAILDSSSVDGTTIAYDSTTGKISSISSAPTVIDGGEEV